MFRIKKTLCLILMAVLSFFSLITISCSKTVSDKSAEFFITKDEKKDKWDQFVQREYINQILDLVFKGDKKQIEEYKNKQYQLDDKLMLSNLDKYLTYVNNIKAGYGNDDDTLGDGPFPFRDYYYKLDNVFSKDWLWALFNLEKFNFVLYDVFDQFSGNVSVLSDQAQKNAVNHGLFRKIYSNNIAQFAVAKSNSRVLTTTTYYSFYLLTDDWNILEIKIETIKDKPSSVKLITYVYTYPKLTQNKFDREVFILDEYVRANISLSKDRTSPDLNNFNEKFGGKPLRYTIFEINSKYLNK
ncbi:aromatic motif membrane protein [Mycoplasma capricolum]|uniref:Lipoprotein n=2 Tax=Mycoplasma capricolum subsp. capricolum TaxID=40479 RepID=A0A0C2W6I2_MYCCA|nr:aromatic motif membrane protein [Mycoplasma capricolum]ABC01087.1 lipoprotein, putative [Mycoplasma capricolum subsp. capricolum ATCC 27343]KIM13892.1 lipoprotein [Mycoplasma capricolum subsp. capricolum]MCK8462030.1 hypothetical protein [Mycoplasma capricolum subsp. capricolum]